MANKLVIQAAAELGQAQRLLGWARS